MEEHKRILIAHSNETIREWLCTIFTRELVGAAVSKAPTEEEFQLQLAQARFDIVVLHQSFVTLDTTLPPGNFVLLATEPTIVAYFFARSNGALAYLMENASRPLLQQTLHLTPGAFLIGPVIAAWLQEYVAHHLFLAIDVTGLTPREQEVFHLHWQGADHHAIAQQLGVTESTVRTHLSHIYEKLHLNRAQMTVLSKWLSQEKQER